MDEEMKELSALEQSAQQLSSAIDILSPYGEGKKKVFYRSFTKSEFEALSEGAEKAKAIAETAVNTAKEISVVKGKINKAEKDRND